MSFRYFMSWEGRRTYQPRRCDYNNKDEVNSLNILSNYNYQASFQKFWLMFSNLVTSEVLIKMIQRVYQPQALLWIFIVNSPSYLSIRPYFLSVPIFCSKIVLFPLHPVVGLHSQTTCRLDLKKKLFWNILFCWYCLTLSQYLWNVLSFVNIFWFNSCCCVCCKTYLRLFFFNFFLLIYPCVFFLFSLVVAVSLFVPLA